MADNNVNHAADTLWERGVDAPDPRIGFTAMVDAACTACGITELRLRKILQMSNDQYLERWRRATLTQEQMDLILAELKSKVTPGAWFDQEKYNALKEKAVQCRGALLQAAKVKYPHLDIFTPAEKIELVEDYWSRGGHGKVMALRIIANQSLASIYDEADPLLKPAFRSIPAFNNTRCPLTDTNAYDVMLTYLMRTAVATKHPTLTSKRQKEYYDDWGVTPERLAAAEKIIASGIAPEREAKPDKVLENLKREVNKRIDVLASGLTMSAGQLARKLGIGEARAGEIIRGEQLTTIEEAKRLDQLVNALVVTPGDRRRLQITEPLAPQIEQYQRALASRGRSIENAAPKPEVSASPEVAAQAEYAAESAVPAPEAGQEPVGPQTAEASLVAALSAQSRLSKATEIAPETTQAAAEPEPTVLTESLTPGRRVWSDIEPRPATRLEPKSPMDRAADARAEKGSGGRGER